MKYKILLWMFMAGLWAACSDDDEVKFDVKVDASQEAIRFTPMPGGAVMRYKLPEDVFGIRVRYQDAWGQPVMKDGSYFCDSLLLDGFTEERTAVTVKLAYLNEAMQESEAVERTFNTEKSATVAVFDKLTVNPFWGGFNVTYSAPETVNGLIHVFYIGENPKTHEQDSILMGSLAITEGGDTLNFPMQQAMNSVDVVVRTDDFFGRTVKQQVVKDVPVLVMDTLAPQDFDYTYTGREIQDETLKFGRKYLFDGDKKGAQVRKARKEDNRSKEFYTYMVGPNAFTERFIVDLRTERVPAAVNLYAYIYLNGGDIYYSSSLQEYWGKSSYGYMTRLPSKVKLYGTNDNPETVDLASCALLASHDEGDYINSLTAPLPPDIENDYIKTWAKRSDYQGKYAYDKFEYGSSFVNVSEQEFEAEEPVCLNLLCNYTGDTYRYLIMIVEDTFASLNYNKRNFNEKQYVTFNELEVCVNAEAKQ